MKPLNDPTPPEPILVPGALAVSPHVELAHSLVNAIAESRGVRALAIKGPVANAHCVRPSRSSADADFLVEPGGFERLTAALRSSGWSARERPRVERDLAMHSVSLVHPAWPCDVDLHSEFPGLLASPADSFEALWCSRITLQMATRAVPSASWAASVLIQTAHSLRGAQTGTRESGELAYLREVVLPHIRESNVLDLMSLAARCGALGSTLNELMPGVADGAGAEVLDPERIARWDASRGDPSSIVARGLYALRVSRGRARLKLLWLLVFPSRADLRRAYPEERVGTMCKRAVLRMRRISGGVRAGLALQARRRQK